jgi:hypothetical protein
MTVDEMNANPNLPTAIRYKERNLKCASCNSDMTWIIKKPGEDRGTGACNRHRNLWIKRAAGVAK